MWSQDEDDGLPPEFVFCEPPLKKGDRRVFSMEMISVQLFYLKWDDGINTHPPAVFHIPKMLIGGLVSGFVQV